jgi:hypothetical protein
MLCEREHLVLDRLNKKLHPAMRLVEHRVRNSLERRPAERGRSVNQCIGGPIPWASYTDRYENERRIAELETLARMRSGDSTD